MLLIEPRAANDAIATEWLALPFDSRCKSRLRATMESDEEAALLLPRGKFLRGGDGLLGSDGRVVEVVSAAEKLMEARSDDRLALARAAYHLGNRYVAVELRKTCIRFGADHVLGYMARGLSLPINDISSPFEPESSAYGAHSHAPQGHSTDGEGRGPRIHEFHK